MSLVGSSSLQNEIDIPPFPARPVLQYGEHKFQEYWQIKIDYIR